MQRYGRHKSVVKRSKKYLEEALYVKLFKDGSSQLSVRQSLKKFVKSRKHNYKWEVSDTLKKLDDRKLYQPALKVTLIIHSYASFTLLESAKNHLCYGALLNCYCKEPMIEKAEGLMEKMKELSLPLSSMPYNSLIMLYTKVGQPEKVSSLIQEMKASNIMLDSYTYNVWMRALAAVNDISNMLEKAEELKEHARRRGAKPNGKTLEIFMDYYLQKGNFKSTVDCLDQAISMGRWNGEKWVPSSKIIDIMMRNFEQERDVDGAEEFLEILKKSMESPGVEVFESLTRTYAATGRISSAML
ncbi:hypothetical protein JHK87_050043 [Glycine soja]|nr:hypothetical protein JHK87_050043 [Glycine soja]